MTPNKRAYKGCRDFLPAQMRVRDYLFNQMKKTADSFAYEAYDGPLLEEVDLYRAKSGEELINDQIYSFIDRGNREVAIRPEMTPTLARMVAGIHKQVAKPLRWYSIPNLMRYEKPQRGRVREHWQFNVDIFGAPTNLGEIEIINVIIHFFTSFGADASMFSLNLNDRRFVDAVFTQLLKLEKEDAYKLYKVLDKSKKISVEKLDTMISEIISEKTKQDLFKEYLALANFDDLVRFVDKNKLQEFCAEFYEFTTLLNELSLTKYVQYDPTIVRGLDYYTGIVFEIFDKHPDNNRAIAGGGAYANLLQIFNEAPLAGVGFGLGDVTLKDFLESHKLLPNLNKPKFDLFIAYTNTDDQKHSLELANKLRANHLNIETYLGKIKFNKIFKLAESKGYQFVAVIETRDGKTQIQIKDLTQNTQDYFDLTEYEKIIQLISKDK
ncbi:MAG: histidine--tRNA ligase [Halobacteriovoraceae bacterium]|jgi:histidyl-tRNA synthetase|nr:histidine--tRNA ligase [Halobacteriovoraceae bacterium]